MEELKEAYFPRCITPLLICSSCCLSASAAILVCFMLYVGFCRCHNKKKAIANAPANQALLCKSKVSSKDVKERLWQPKTEKSI